MTGSHDMIEELLAVRALGGLDGDDRAILERELEAHGDCDECRRLGDELDETAGRLGLALEPMPVSPGMVDRILAVELGAEAQPRPRVGEPGPRAGRMRRVFAVAASFVVIVAAVAIGRASSGPDVVAAQRFIELRGEEGVMVLAYTPGERGVLVFGRGLPDPGAGKVYELWAITGGTPESQACLRSVDGSIGTYLDVELEGGADTVALTVEPASCPTSPTTQPVYSADLS